MHVALTPEQSALREEIAAYFRRLVTPELAEALREHGATPTYKEVIRRMGRDGTLAVGWPKEHGGRGLGPVEQLIFVREALRAGAPIPFVTLSTVGPTLMAHGTAEQKARYLPGIAEGRIHFAIGYSEPSSGTDLASLRTRAVPDGNGFRVNGSKIYTSHVEGADHIWLAVRTDPDAPKHKGISILVVDRDAAGVSHTPIETVAGMRTNATYYEDVWVPGDALVGPLNGGWNLITSQLNHERIGIAARGVHGEALYDRTLAWAEEPDAGGRRPIEDPTIRRLLALVHARLDTLRVMNYRLAWMAATGQADIAFGSAAKAHGVDVLLETCRDLLQVVGPGGLVRHGSAAARLQGDLEMHYRLHQNATFGGGSAEVMREIVAQRGLGLPRTVR